MLNSTRYDNDPGVHHTNRTAVCDTNLAGALLANGSMVGVWRHCETVNLHTVPHTLLARDPVSPDGKGFVPSGDINFPYLSHAAAEDPFVSRPQTALSWRRVAVVSLCC